MKKLVFPLRSIQGLAWDLEINYIIICVNKTFIFIVESQTFLLISLCSLYDLICPGREAGQEALTEQTRGLGQGQLGLARVKAHPAPLPASPTPSRMHVQGTI